MVDILVTGKRISDMELIKNVTGEEKIPTGVVGDYAITPNQISDFVNTKVVSKWGSLVGDIDEQLDLKNKLTLIKDSISSHVNNEENPHKVTKVQVGLGNVDNTSDINKPVSTATQNALDLKLNTSDAVTSVIGLKGDITQDGLSEALNLGDLANKNQDDVLIDSNVRTWSGLTQEIKNRESISPQDFGAKGDGVTNDSQPFIQLESEHQGLNIDLQGKTYVVNDWYLKNNYINGKFSIFGNLYSSEMDIYSIAKKSLAMNFYTGDAGIPNMPPIFGGSKNTFQSFCIVPMDDGLHFFVNQRAYNDGSYTDYGNFLSGETYRIVEYLFKEDGSTQQPISFSEPIRYMGHASDLGYRFENGELFFYSGAPNESTTNTLLGGKGFSRIRWRGSDTSNSDVQVYELFDQPSVRDGNYPDMCKCAVAVNHDGKILLTGNTKVNTKTLIYDLDEILNSSDIKAVKPLYDLEMVNQGRTFQGIAYHGDLLYTVYDDIAQTGTVIIYDMSATEVRNIQNIELAKYYNSYSKYRGGEGTILHMFEMEGIYVFGNALYVGHREYWHKIETVVSYKGNLYAPRVEVIPVGTLPTSTDHFLQVDPVAGITPTEFNASTTYTYSATRVDMHKRITKLDSLGVDGMSRSNHPLNTPKTKSATVIDLPRAKSIYLRHWDESQGLQDFLYYNPSGNLRWYKPDSNYPLCGFRLSMHETNEERFSRLRGGESYGGTIQLRSTNDTTKYGGGIVEYVGIGKNILSRWTNSTGTTTFNTDESSKVLNFQRKEVDIANLYTSTTNFALVTDSVPLHFGTSKEWRWTVDVDGLLKPYLDNSYSLGSAEKRVSQVYSATGTINTSDEREKQQFRSQTEREKASALEIKKAICLFKFNDAVDLKGDGARWHVGIKAQEVVKILESNGLDWREYGFICYDEWNTGFGDEVASRYAVRYEELAMFILMAI